MSDMDRMASQRLGGKGKTASKGPGRNRSGADITAAQHAAHKGAKGGKKKK